MGLVAEVFLYGRQDAGILVSPATLITVAFRWRLHTQGYRVSPLCGLYLPLPDQHSRHGYRDSESYIGPAGNRTRVRKILQQGTTSVAESVGAVRHAPV